ncbi:hypothetical protein FEM48_Zijuj04G0167700 [Ziziphus jujuba var. spinosa]|uniref:Ubiquitin fusion degradation protein 1 homolog n=1 Tax=Ziziphus jujuba var. spinosa TaxID=714518 RepID=A0A978VL07_ZIZJJ|nr:hypothetical protein FEM48_Zijuj04G0167700 [Ziziphus jujuba var. spinosa]
MDPHLSNKLIVAFGSNIPNTLIYKSGDKIILPESALLRLSHMDIQYPMLFHLRSSETGRVSYCGVVEFSSKEGQEATSRCSPTPPILYIFPNPKSVLESALIRGFTCLSAGDTIMIMHEGKKFYINVLETKPVSAIRVNVTDCEVDFAPPLDYNEPEKVKPADKIIEKASMEVGKKEKQEEPKFRPFMGVAKRLDGSPVLTSVSASERKM